MNRKQRIAIGTAIVLVALSGFFLPYEGEFRVKGDNLKAYLGYHFIFAPPKPEVVAHAILGRDTSSASTVYLSRFRAHIIVSRVVVQMATIALITLGIVALLADKKEGTDK